MQSDARRDDVRPASRVRQVCLLLDGEAAKAVELDRLVTMTECAWLSKEMGKESMLRVANGRCG